MHNNIRYDLSNWLIHFFRDVDLDSDASIDIPEHIGWNNIFEYDNSPLQAFFLLRCAIRQQRIWATWSYRGGVRTIYGLKPAVCFTDMPIAAFFEAAELRKKRGEHISSYAILIDKTQLAQYGALPVIYGLSQKYSASTDPQTGARIIDLNCLPLEEQYRFVTYNPSPLRTIDWTHEREWRWGCHHNVQKNNNDEIVSFEEMPALTLSTIDLCGMGIVVNDSQEAQYIRSDLLTLIDRGLITENKYKFILSLSSIPSIQSLQSLNGLTTAINQALINPLAGLTVNNTTMTYNNNILNNLACQLARTTPSQSGEKGKAWLWLYDNTHPFTRSMKAIGRLYVSNDGRYLVDIPEFSESRSLRQQENMIKQLAAALQTQIGIQCGYFSVLGHNDPNREPFYCSPPDNPFIYNEN
ncbi:DUF4427 domain-containing protein [Desulfovibrio inopinatus]|uniref:DUF4427 domain-containing protein n=1 Tax=Desulfovibrio inopinatus TaxID=102109 RepID=UPI000429EB28|nr:DUF4427 domain-containing protein [Desulfovibrio inopinatus]